MNTYLTNGWLGPGFAQPARPASAFVLLVALATALVAVAWHPQLAEAWTRTVCPSGCDYTRIDTAVTHFPSLGPGDIVRVTSGNYYERVIVSKCNGAPGNPATIEATGPVTIDGSDPYSDPEQWSQYNGSNVWSASVPFANGTEQNQVFVDNSRFLYIHPDSLSTPGNYTTVPPNRFTYGTGQMTTYVNAGGVNPGDYQTTAISVRSAGFDVDETSYLTIRGFTVQRTTDKGIDVRGAGTDGDSLNVREVRIENCTSAFNARQGIYLRNGVNSTVDNNVTFSNASHGIHLPLDSACVVIRNRSYLNDDPYKTNIAGSVTGIKVGDSGATKDARYITVDYNISYDNEDSGIAFKGSKRILARRNVSYSNGDHGFDNVVVDSVAFVNNVSARNDHDGMSIENDATNVRLSNCVLWHNGVNAATLNPGSDPRVRELFVDNTTGFVSNYNVICGLAPDTTSAYTRYLVEFPGSGVTHAYASWARYRQNQGSHDTDSYASEPGFIDSTTTAGFKVEVVSSDAIDAATTDLTGWTSPFWLSTDPRGFVAHDNDSIPNAGSGTPNYVEIGAYEYDIAPAAMTDLRADVYTSTSVHLLWTATGDDGTVGRAPTTALRYSRSAITEGTFWTDSVGPTATTGYPGTTRDTTVSGLTPCTVYWFAQRYGGGVSPFFGPAAMTGSPA